jgi:cation diffusion facilitator family transporter
MNSVPTNTKQKRYNKVRKVTLIGSVVDFLLGITKIFIGWVAHSQALIADGIHSLSDLATDFIVLYAAKHAHKEADEDHPYGHGRIETLATVGLGVTLVIIAGGIAYDAVMRLNDPDKLLQPGLLALVVAAVSVVAKEGIYHYTINVARSLRSDMLMANAWHSRSDAITSVVVVIGIAGAMFGYPYLDAVAAVAVSVMIAKIGVDLVRTSSKELIDTALEPQEIDTIRRYISSVSGVRAMHMLRSRKSAGDAFIDVHIQVDPRLSVSDGHQVGETVRRQLMDKMDIVSDVTVHIDPENDESGFPCNELPSREKVLSDLKQQWSQFTEVMIENVTLHYLSGKIHVDLDLPLDTLPNISEAKSLAQKLKQAVSSLSYIRDVQIRFIA